MKKTIELGLLLTITASLFIQPIYAKENINLESSDEPMQVNEISNNKEQLKKIQEIEKENASNLLSIEDIKNMSSKELEKLELIPYDDDSNLSSKNITTRDSSSYVLAKYYYFQQINGYYCGPATSLGVLKAAGKYNDISGNTVADKQQTLADEMYCSTSGTWINYIPPVLNDYDDRYRQWTYDTISDSYSDKSTMEYRIRCNHTYYDQVIYLVKSRYLSYYSSSTTACHYIGGSGIYYDTNLVKDFDNIRLRLGDPHYNNTYFGLHYEPFNNVNNAMYQYHLEIGPANMVW